MTNINKLSEKGQSIWLDSLSKQMIESGDLKNLITMLLDEVFFIGKKKLLLKKEFFSIMDQN